MRTILLTLAYTAALSLVCGTASAATIFDSEQIRFGNGTEDSINNSGLPKQPFYYNDSATTWYPLTYDDYPLDSAIGVGGDGTDLWNINGQISSGFTLSGQTTDTSLFTKYDGDRGYGILTTEGSVTLNSINLGYRATYQVSQNSPYVNIIIQLTNNSAQNAENLRFWLGTRDDFIDTEDQPQKTRGNLTNGSFVSLTSAGDQAQALQITSGDSGVLFFSTSDNSYVIQNLCCSFQNVIDQNPTTSSVQATNDGSYGFYVRMKDLAPGESDSFTWFYGAGDIADLADIAQSIQDAATSKEIVEDVSSGFDNADFTGDSGLITRIRIASLPAHGTLTLNTTPVSVGQEITSAEYSLLNYTPDADFTGTDQFTWQGWDGSGFNILTTVSLQVLRDTDSDGIADVNDDDDDGDGVDDTSDAFPLDATETTDTDGDGIGNNADTDDDNDGVDDTSDDLPLDPTDSVDTDGDGIGNSTDTDDDGDGVDDASDTFPLDGSETTDSDGDGTGDNADTDDDNDGVSDTNDAFPLDATETTDTDGDGIGNNADTDDDNDGVSDTQDTFPLDAGETTDFDGDGIGDNSDTDNDNDGIGDAEDLFPHDPAESADTDGDGIGNHADTDDDNDGVSDASDAFPLDATETTDTDGDGIGNNADTDDDNDGMSDSWENTWGFDSLDSSDAALDSDGDGATNAAEAAAGTNPHQDTVPPQISLASVIRVDATGLFTLVNLGDITATDYLDGAVEVSGNREARLSPGQHTLTYQATDSAGNTAQATQTVYVRPLINFAKDQSVTEGNQVTVKVLLNGPSPEYPVTIPYQVTGTAIPGEDDDLSDGVVTISSGTEGSITFQTLADTVEESDETIVISMLNSDGTLNTGNKPIHTVTISESNIAPEINLSVIQNQIQSAEISRRGGPVTITATVTDSNLQDTHSLQWNLPAEISDNAAMTNQSAITFNPATLASGLYRIGVTVNDSGSPQRSDSATQIISITETTEVLTETDDTDQDGLSDLEEGYNDSDNDGIYDYMDNQYQLANVIGHLASEGNYNLLESDPGTRLHLGQTALRTGRKGTLVHTSDAYDDTQTIEADSAIHSGGLFDFEVHDIATHGQSVNVVIPQRSAIPDHAIYRKWSATRGWRTFTEDSRNSLASAPGQPGYCPPPGDKSFETGLIAGYWCVQLTIEDGGPNDNDQNANGTIIDPGGIATRTAISEKVKTGGGGFSPFAGLLLGLLFSIRLRQYPNHHRAEIQS
ncbi:Alpha-agarase precursor [Vibrio aerogenes CECT 7868]|uniref:Alpha-agarase n=1 Tax=Vibrio aerogenes CECT 7868 TaxID=1216006 RepID=A0A1M5UT84_9VIBR|nr:thrombospondin type 3 repeat-containing protein [Vibrio aerogenes]SHH66199.1 Alpha-agarase precursor [Vibrio aerogenes CECT 7868]